MPNLRSSRGGYRAGGLCLVCLLEAGLHDGQHYLAMRFMPGGTLAQWAKTRPVEPRRAAEIVLSLARAIAYAHQHGVLHRDLKPGNVLLDDNGEPHLADFGLARLGELEGGITLTSAILGTAPYMPPEQVVGGVGVATTAGDIYCLGAVLYELLTGRPPFTGSSVADILRKVQEDEPGAPLACKSKIQNPQCQIPNPKSSIPSGSSESAWREDPGVHAGWPDADCGLANRLPHPCPLPGGAERVPQPFLPDNEGAGDAKSRW